MGGGGIYYFMMFPTPRENKYEKLSMTERIIKKEILIIRVLGKNKKSLHANKLRVVRCTAAGEYGYR